MGFGVVTQTAGTRSLVFRPYDKQQDEMAGHPLPRERGRSSGSGKKSKSQRSRPLGDARALVARPKEPGYLLTILGLRAQCEVACWGVVLHTGVHGSPNLLWSALRAEEIEVEALIDRSSKGPGYLPLPSVAIIAPNLAFLEIEGCEGVVFELIVNDFQKRG